jgi:predicted Zn-dependent protease
MPFRLESRRRNHFRSAVVALALLLVSVKSAAAQQPPSPPPPPPAFKFTDVDLELLEKSNELDKYMDERGMVYSDPALTEYVTALGDDLLPPGPDPEHVIWKFHVLRDPIPNAFALANGSIYINTGLLALLENEAQLASVIAHEETHVLNRHPYLENRSYRKKSVAANILAGVGSVGGGAGGIGGAASLLMGALAPAIVESTIYGYSRELEKEADIRAVAAVNQADYSTEEMINAFKLLESSHEVELSHVFYQDHPKLDDRISYISDVIHDTRPHTHHPMVEEERYVAATEKASRDNIALDIRAGRERTAVAVAERLAKQNPKSSEDFRALGDAFRALGPRTPDPTPDELSSKGKRDARKMETKLTDQEYDNALMATPEGLAAMAASQKQSEDAYRRALELDPENATAHRGLGFLYEKERLRAQCAEEFRKYLELAPNAPDQAQIRRRLEATEKEGSPAVTTPVAPNVAPSPKP